MGQVQETVIGRHKRTHSTISDAGKIVFAEEVVSNLRLKGLVKGELVEERSE